MRSRSFHSSPEGFSWRTSSLLPLLFFVIVSSLLLVVVRVEAACAPPTSTCGLHFKSQQTAPGHLPTGLIAMPGGDAQILTNLITCAGYPVNNANNGVFWAWSTDSCSFVQVLSGKTLPTRMIYPVQNSINQATIQTSEQWAVSAIAAQGGRVRLIGVQYSYTPTGGQVVNNALDCIDLIIAPATSPTLPYDFSTWGNTACGALDGTSAAVSSSSSSSTGAAKSSTGVSSSSSTGAAKSSTGASSSSSSTGVAVSSSSTGAASSSSSSSVSNCAAASGSGTKDCTTAFYNDNICYYKCCRSSGDCFSNGCPSTFNSDNSANAECSKPCQQSASCTPVSSGCTSSNCLGFVTCLTSACGGFNSGDACLLANSGNFKVCQPGSATIGAGAILPATVYAMNETCSYGVINLSHTKNGLNLAAGQTIYAGYAMSATSTTTVKFTSGVVTIPVWCSLAERTADEAIANSASTSTKIITIPIGSSIYTMTSGLWYPTNDHTSANSYEASMFVPNLCNGGYMYASSKVQISAAVRAVSSNTAATSISFKWHYGKLASGSEDTVAKVSRPAVHHSSRLSVANLPSSAVSEAPNHRSLFGVATSNLATLAAVKTAMASDTYELSIEVSSAAGDSSDGTDDKKATAATINAWGDAYTISSLPACVSKCHGGTETYNAPTPSTSYNYSCCDSSMVPTQTAVTSVPSVVKVPARTVAMSTDAFQNAMDSCFTSSWVSCIFLCGVSFNSCISNVYLSCFKSLCGSTPSSYSSTCNSNLATVQNYYTGTATQLRNYQIAQDAGCSCVKGTATNTTTPPSPLESWPFYAITPGTPSQDLFALIDLKDFVSPSIALTSWATGDENTYLATYMDRPDIVALSSALEVIGVDYYRGSTDGSATVSNSLVGGMIIAKGHQIIEHSIPTCARFAGGKVKSVVRSVIAGFEFVTGTVQQSGVGGNIITTTLVLQLQSDQLSVTSAWAPTQMKLMPNILGVVTIQLWASLNPLQQDPQFFSTLVQHTLARLSTSIVPVKFDGVLLQNNNAQPSSYLPMHMHVMDASDSTTTNTEPSPADFWVESISFTFPHFIHLVIKSPIDSVADLNVQVIGWSEANAHKNSSLNVDVKSNQFRAYSGGEVVLQQNILSTQLTLNMKNVLDTVFVVSPKTLSKVSNSGTAATSNVKEYVDQVFTNLGFFFYTGVAGGSFVAGISDLSAEFDPPPAFPKATRQSMIILPGSGRIVVQRPRINDTDVFGVVRSLTPVNADIDLSAQWGVGLFVRLNSYTLTNNASSSASSVTPSVRIQLRVETSGITDSNYPISPPIELEYAPDVTADTTAKEMRGCWMHVQFEWRDFTDAVHGNAIQTDRVQRFSLISTANDVIQDYEISFAAFSVQSRSVPASLRKLFASCSNTSPTVRQLPASSDLTDTTSGAQDSVGLSLRVIALLQVIVMGLWRMMH